MAGDKTKTHFLVNFQRKKSLLFFRFASSAKYLLLFFLLHEHFTI